MNWNGFAHAARCAVLAVLNVSFVLAAGSAFADDDFASPFAGLDKTSTGSNSAALPTALPSEKIQRKKSTRDPVAAAMALPKGTVLSKQQQEAYDKLEADQGADLRQALDDVAQAKTSTQKNKALKAIREARLAIRAGMASILSSPMGGNSQSGGSSSSSSYASTGDYSTGNNGTSYYGNGNGSGYNNTLYGNSLYGGYGTYYYAGRGYMTGTGGSGTSTGSGGSTGGGSTGGGSMSGGCQSGGSGGTSSSGTSMGGRSHR